MTAKMLQQFNLPQSPFGQYLFTEDIGDLLDRYSLASLIIGSSAVYTYTYTYIEHRQRSAMLPLLTLACPPGGLGGGLGNWESGNGELGIGEWGRAVGGKAVMDEKAPPTKRFHKHLDQAPWSHYTAHRR